MSTEQETFLLHFVAFFHVESLLSTGVDNKKVGVDNEKALELTNSAVFHRGRQLKSSRARQQNNFFFTFHPDFNVEISPKNATKHPVHTDPLCQIFSKNCFNDKIVSK